MPSSRFLRLAIAASCLAISASFPSQAQTKRAMTLVEMLSIPRIDDPQITMDGRRVAFQVRSIDWAGNRRVPQIWQIDADGTKLQQVTTMDGGAYSPRWSPDGATLAFLSRGQIHLVTAGERAPKQLSQHATPLFVDYAWAPSGASIYFLAPDPLTDAQRRRQQLRGDMIVLDEFRQHRHLWRIDVADGRETRITSGDYSIYAFELSPDGRQIAFSQRPTLLPVDTNKMEVAVMNADGSGIRQLTKNNFPEGDAALSPDGSQVLFLARTNERLQPYYNANVFLVPAAGGTPSVLLKGFPYEVLRAEWSVDGTSIWMVVNMGVHSQLFQVDVATRTPKQLTSGNHAIIDTHWSLAGDRSVFVIDEPTRIGDVWTYAPGSAAPKRVTGMYDHLDRDFALPRQERVEWKGADGVAVEGILSYPTDYKVGTRYPLVVQLHGGPEASDRFGWGSIFYNIQPGWTGRGYAILRPNYRGSSGYGDAFYREPVGGYFKNSHLDVIAGVDRLVAMGVADPDRVGITGWSAGGHLVNKLITFTTRFRAASSGAGVSNWISMYGQSDTHAERDLWLGGTLWQRDAPIQTYWDHSPLKYVAAARTPTIFFVGENDTRVPMAQSIEMFRALRGMKVPAELHIAPGEGHVWSRPGHELAKMNAEIEWFEKHLRNAPYTWEAIPASTTAGTAPGR